MNSNDQHIPAVVFGASAYANAVPLSRFIREVCPVARMVQDVPAALPEKLLGGAVDVALIPVAALLTEPRMEMIPGIGVCAKAAVWSVLLKLHRPVVQVRTVQSDPASRTSNALAGIILARRYGLRGKLRSPGPGETPDAEVMIGDRALCAPAAPCGDLDLGAEWNAMTGLPFVFAVWACRAGEPRKEEFTRIAARARDAGVAALDRLAQSEAERLRLPLARCREYFTLCIHYQVGPRELDAIRLFGELLKPDTV